MTRPLPAYLSPRAGSGTRRVLRRLVRSRSLRESVAAAFGPAVVCSGLLVAVVVINVLARGGFVDWSGFHPIPTGGTK